MSTKKPTGRPSTYTPEIAADICAHLAEGGLLIDWCRQPGRPNVATVNRWMEAHPSFRAEYARARETGLHVRAEQVIAISDDRSGDYKTDADGREVVDHEHIQRARLRVDSRKWLASKLLPKIYGDKQQLDVTDSRPLANVPAETLRRAVEKLAKPDGEGGNA